MIKDNVFIAKLARKGAEETKGKFGKMCKECAFRENSPANLEVHNVEKAKYILDEIAYFGQSDKVFNCHIQSTYIVADELCVGFQYAKKYLSQL